VTEEHATTGTTTTRQAVAVVPRWEDSGKFYGLEDDLRILATTYGHRHRFDGWLVREGEEQGDVERYTIRDGQVIAEKAQMRWPDGTTAP
jgi:hypothetical protein